MYDQEDHQKIWMFGHLVNFGKQFLKQLFLFKNLLVVDKYVCIKLLTFFLIYLYLHIKLYIIFLISEIFLLFNH